MSAPSKIIVLSTAIALACFGNALASGGCHDEESKGSMMEHKGSAVDKGTAEAVNVGNTICPVSGEDIESMGGGVQEEYNGKIYNFCCASCAKVFKKDPEKYSRIAEESAEESTEESMEGEHTGSHHAH